MNTTLTGILTGRTRQIVYIIYTVAGLGLGATQVAYSASNSGQPSWLTVALAVFGFLGAAIGATAASNVGTDQPVRSIEYGTSLAEREALEGDV